MPNTVLTEDHPFFVSNYMNLLFLISLLIGLYLSSLYNHVFFHTIAEIFSIVIACCIFIFAWNSQKFSENNYFLFIGIAYLFVAGTNIIYILVYQRNEVSHIYDINLLMQLSIITKCIESISLFIAPFFINKIFKSNAIFIVYGIIWVFLLLSALYWNILPECFLQNSGLTDFGKNSNDINSLLLLGAAIHLYMKRIAFDSETSKLLVVAIIVALFSELTPGLLSNFHSIANVIGYFLKIISFYLIYKAIIEKSLLKPYILISKNLKQSNKNLKLEISERKKVEKALRKSEKKLEERVKERTQQFFKINEKLKTKIIEQQHAEEKLQENLGKLEKAIEGTISVITLIIEKKDPYTAHHQRRVAALATAIAKKLSLPPEQTNKIRIAAFIHDIGKISIPAEILSKPGMLNTSEFNLIKSHPRVGYDVIKATELPSPIAEIILQHHEKLDGSGYPLGLANNNISIEAKIITVADVVEALASHRPYRPGLGFEKALTNILKNRGILYDSNVVDACCEIFFQSKKQENTEALNIFNESFFFHKITPETH